MSNKRKNKIKTMGIKYLRRVLGIIKSDRIRNQANRSELEVEALVKKIQDNCSIE